MARSHSIHNSPYHDCARCGCTQHISEMTWQNGILICKTNDCVDEAVVGSRDMQIAKALENSTGSELAPDDKLLHPDAGVSADDVIFDI